MPLIETRGAASAQGFGEFAKSSEPVYVESCFSTYLYTGNGSTQTITNGIDLSTKGGLVWMKSRSAATNNFLFDTSRGALNELNSNTTEEQTSLANSLTAFSTSGFALGSAAGINVNAATYASWTFREQAKFFDVVTYTGNGINDRQLNHSLESIPRWIFVKRLNASEDWLGIFVTSDNGTSSTNAFTGSINLSDALFNVGSGSVTATTFRPWVARNSSNTINGNVSGATYVAYLFAHNAGGFGLSGTDNVISCGSYTGNGSSTGPVVTLGYEPQWLLVKNSTGTGDWNLIDNMRGFVVGGADAELNPNLSNAESTGTFVSPTATGFQINTTNAGYNTSSSTYIYIAIRRGPMKVPTSGTQVFSPNTSSSPAGTVITTGFPLDASLTALRAGGYGNVFLDRLRGFQTIPYGTTVNSAYLVTNTTGAEQSLGGYSAGVNNTGFQIPNTWADLSTIYYSFRRAPGFFDVVCYTGTGVARTINHNLAAVPELMIVRRRSSIANWAVNSQSLTASDYLYLNSTDPQAGNTSPAIWNSTRPTSTVFSVGTSALTNENAQTFVAYLFATVAGVSKVGSYTGTGTTQVINCGFTAGSRFVMIKRTNSTGDWYVWDSARGIVAGNDPYLLLNSTAAEVTNTDYIDTAATGFEISSTAPAAINASGGNFIFLAIS